MLKVLTRLLTIFFFLAYGCTLFAHNTATSPSVPDRIDLTLPMILQGTLKTVQFQKLQLQLLTKDSARVRVESQLEPRSGASLSLLNNHAQALGPTATDNAQHYQLKLSHNQMLKTGTALTAEWLLEHRSADFTMEQLPDSSSYQSQFAFAVKQSLTRNFWGKSYQAQLDAARMQEQAIEQRVASETETMLMGIVEIYHRAWLVRERLAAARRNLALQWRLRKVIRAKSELGTAEETDLLQVKSAVAESRQRVRDSKKTLKDIWYQLVIPMRLPPEYLDVDVEKITIALESGQEFALATCKDWQQQNFDNLQTSPQMDFYKKSWEALQYRLMTQKERLYPDIFVALRVTNNGMNESFGTSIFDSVFSADLTLSLTAGIEMTLGNHAARADLKDIVQQQHMLELNIAQLKDNLRLNALTGCDRVRRLLAKEKVLKRVLSNNKQRVALLEEKFELGQTEVLSVIQAGREVISTELQLKETVQDMAVSAWKIRQNAGQVLTYLQGLIEK